MTQSIKVATKKAAIKEDAPVVQKRASFVQALEAVLYQHFQGGAGTLSEFFAAQEARAFYNKRYDSIKEAFIKEHDNSVTQVGEGEKAIIDTDDTFSVVLSVTNGATITDATKLANELHKLVGKKLTIDMVEDAIRKATIKRSGAKRFEVVVGSG